MSFFKRAKKTTPPRISHDPSGQAHYPFTFGELTSDEFRDYIHAVFTRHDANPIEGARELLEMLHDERNKTIVSTSTELQDIIFGNPDMNGRRHGPIHALLMKAIEHHATNPDLIVSAKFRALDNALKRIMHDIIPATEEHKRPERHESSASTGSSANRAYPVIQHHFS